jgi:hypothetical protein
VHTLDDDEDWYDDEVNEETFRPYRTAAGIADRRDVLAGPGLPRAVELPFCEGTEARQRADYRCRSTT